MAKILIVIFYGLFTAVSYAVEFPMLEARLSSMQKDLEFIPNERYDHLGANLKGVGEDYELELIVGRRGSMPGEMLLPTSVTVHENQVYLVDFGNKRIQVFDLHGNFIKMLELEGISHPIQLKIEAGKIYVVDQGTASIHVFDLSGKFLRKLGKKGVRKGFLNAPNGVAIGNDGLIWVSDDKNNRVEVFAYNKVFGRDSHYIMNLEEYLPNKYLRAPRSVHYMKESKTIYVIDGGTARILSFDKLGNYVGPILDYGDTKTDRVFMPQSLHADFGNLYVADHISHSVLIYGANRKMRGIIGKVGQIPEHLTKKEEGEGLDEGSAVSTKKTSDFIVTDSTMSFPIGLATERNGDLWVCDWGNNQLKKYSLSFFRKAKQYYKEKRFKLAIKYFKKCPTLKHQYHVVEFYLAMCHYYLGISEAFFEKRLQWFKGARKYLDVLKLKSEIGKFNNDWISDKVLYYLSRVSYYRETD